MTLRTAALAVIAIAIIGAACSGAQGLEAKAVVAQAREAMISRSFSVTTTCPSCDPPQTLEYAPPDRIKLSHSPGNDAWEFNLIVGDRWYYSSRGERWREGFNSQLAFMPLADPRVLFRYTTEPGFQKDEMLNGVEHYVVAARVDHGRFIDEVLRENFESEGAGDELRNLEQFIEGLRLRFWIDKETLVVSQMETDYPPFPEEPGEEESEDPRPIVVGFDFEAPVEIPLEPISLPSEEARRLDDVVKGRADAIRGAVIAYNEELGAYPPRADLDLLSEFLSAGWPINPYNDQRMIQSAVYSPGDFCYEPGLDGEPYRFGTYGWDNSLGQTIPGCVPAD